jgi:dTDP-4-dehydrorhamnose 3,5-epimerase
MTFSETSIPGAYIVQIRKFHDARGFFGRGWCSLEFAEHNLNPTAIQLNIGYSHKKGTLRGMHFQEAPFQEAKSVRCVRGAIYDVVVDLRPDSPTHCKWFGIELNDKGGDMLYIPEGCAHGYQTLTDETEMHYITSSAYEQKASRGVRFDDPAFGIEWPLPVCVISDADKNWPAYVVA